MKFRGGEFSTGTKGNFQSELTKSCSPSCGKSQTPCKVPPSPRRLAGEPQTAVFRPLPNTPSKASLPPLYGEKCHLCVRYNVLPMSQAAH
jgi:hypothetical protein